MKKFFTLSLFILALSAFSQELLNENKEILGNNPQVKSVISYSLLKGDYRYTYVYDNNGTILTEVKEFFKNEEWVNSTRAIYEYDGDHLLLLIYQVWENDQWVNSSKSIYEYNSQGKLSSKIEQEWKNGMWLPVRRYLYEYETNKTIYTIEKITKDQWTKEERTTYEYDNDGFIISYLYEKWSNENWEPQNKYNYSYDSHKNLIEIVSQSWQNGEWVNQYSEYNEYDENNNIIRSKSKIWQNDQWEDIARSAYTYDQNGNELTYTSEFWDGEEWINDFRTLKTYTSFGEIAEEIEQNWNETEWVNYRKLTYEYNNDQLLYSITNYEWLLDAWEFKDYYYLSFHSPTGRYYYYLDCYKIEIFYTEPTGIKEQIDIVNTYSIFPNPASQFIKVNYNLKEASHVSISIRNLVGDEASTLMNDVFQEQGNHNFIYNLNNINAGVYYLIIKADNNIITQKLIVIK